MLIRILFLSLIFLSNLAYADTKRIVESIATVDSLGTIVTTIAVPSQATIYTKSFDVAQHQASETVGVMYKATSSGTVNLTIVPQQSWSRPTTESAVDATYIAWDTTETTSNTNWRETTLDTVTMPYGRFQIVGGSGNDASTTIQIKVAK